MLFLGGEASVAGAMKVLDNLCIESLVPWHRVLTEGREENGVPVKMAGALGSQVRPKLRGREGEREREDVGER